MIDRAQAEDKPMIETRPRGDRIREAAHERYLMRLRGEVGGDESTDRLEAEAQIDAEDAGG